MKIIGKVAVTIIAVAAVRAVIDVTNFAFEIQASSAAIAIAMVGGIIFSSLYDLIWGRF